MYSLTFCHCLQKRGWFLLTVFFFLIASVEAGLLSSASLTSPDPLPTPSFLPFLQTMLKTLLKSIT